MSITLTISQQPTAIPGQATSKTFEQGGTIGRTKTCDWVLVDPSRFISGKHAVISQVNDVYQITDTSTNGIFVNGSGIPLGKGNNVQLTNGDTLTIGEYQISVNIQEAAQAAPSDFTAEPQLASFLPDNLFDGLAPNQPEINDIAPPSTPKPIDPLQLLAASSSPEIPELKPFSEPSLEFGAVSSDSLQESEGSNAPAIQGNFIAPNIIPDDWLTNEAAAPAKSSPRAPAQRSPTTKTQARRNTSTKSAAKQRQKVSQSNIQRPPSQPNIPQPPSQSNIQRQPSFNSTNSSDAIAVATKPRKKTASKTSTASNQQQALKALLRGMGMEQLRIPAEDVPTFMLTVGEMLRTSIEGTYSLLRTRTNIKSEFRMSMTTIQAVENNPLKFSVGVIEALNNMFNNSADSYLPPKQAISEAFADIEDHQLAVMAGTQAALVAMITRFDPISIENNLEDKSSRSNLLGNKKAKYWEAYNDYFEDIAKAAEDDFQSLFGEDFARAYEDQVNQLQTARKYKK